MKTAYELGRGGDDLFCEENCRWARCEDCPWHNYPLSGTEDGPIGIYGDPEYEYEPTQEELDELSRQAYLADSSTQEDLRRENAIAWVSRANGITGL